MAKKLLIASEPSEKISRDTELLQVGLNDLCAGLAGRYGSSKEGCLQYVSKAVGLAYSLIDKFDYEGLSILPKDKFN